MVLRREGGRRERERELRTLLHKDSDFRQLPILTICPCSSKRQKATHKTIVTTLTAAVMMKKIIMFGEGGGERGEKKERKKRRKRSKEERDDNLRDRQTDRQTETETRTVFCGQ